MMFSFLKLNPWLIGGAVVVGFAIGSFATVQTYERFIVPGRMEDAQQAEREKQLLICRNTTNTAAAAAMATERARQSAAAEAALIEFRDQAIVREAARVRAIELLEEENADYARQLVETGRSCPLDDVTIDWLRNGPGPAID